MVKRSLSVPDNGLCILSPGLAEAQVLDLMCSHFVLRLVVLQGIHFNVRRDCNSIIGLTGRHLVWPNLVLYRLREFLSRRCIANTLWRGHELLSPADFLSRFGVWNGPVDEGSLFFYLDDYAKDHPKDLVSLLSSTSEWLAQVLKKQSSLVEKNINALSSLLQLNKAERALLLYGTMARYQRDMRSILVEFKVNNAPDAFEVLAEVAGVRPQELREALRAGSRLERIGLVENLISEHNITDIADLMKVSEKLPPVLMRQYRDQAELMAVFTRLSTKSTLSKADFGFVQDDVEMLCSLLSNAVQRKEIGINVLLYGPPGTGKTELAKVVAQAAGVALFEVEYADRDGNSLSGRDRYRSLQIAQVFLKGYAQAALLFDEVEDVFPRVSSDTGQLLAISEHDTARTSSKVNGKAWVNQILETNPVPTLWITNRIDQIDPAFMRRFAYHLELQSPPPGARERMVQKALEGTSVSADFRLKLAGQKGLTPAQIRTAVRFAKLACPSTAQLTTSETTSEATSDTTPSNGVQLEVLIERQLRNANVALGQRPAQSMAADAGATYDLSYLHIESRFEVTRVIQALQARGHGSLCFFGPPGTGKSALAAHIAHALSKPLLVRQASDLMSKYVGETEQKMASMFQEAESEGAVLLLDEADSFLQDRRGAERHYEITEVNEMLQGMERFHGVFICTTNLMQSIDQAALRRFSFKMEFKPLSKFQKEKFFIQQACLGDSLLLTEGFRQRLQQLHCLCIGDFASVIRQAYLLDTTLSAHEFMEQLEMEHRLKPEVRDTRAMGFVQ